MTIEELKVLAKCAVTGKVPSNFELEDGKVLDAEAALRDALRPMAGSINQFMKNRYDIYEILIEAADEIVPAKVIDAISMFAEVVQVGQGQQIMFKKKLGRSRARQFLTNVGLSGVYETFRLDTDYFTLLPQALGGAVAVDFERYLDGAEDLSELMAIVTEDLTDAIYQKVQEALRAAINDGGRPLANKVSGSWSADAMFKLCRTVAAYGSNAAIFAPPEFIAAMGADAIVPISTYGSGDTANAIQGVYHPQDIDRIHNQGYINLFRGFPVVMLKQSFTDETNKYTWIDPQFAYVLPTGGERVVKVGMEGNTQIWDFVNADQSIEMHFYKKVGVAILTHYNWGVYKNTGITQTYVAPFDV